MNTPPTVAPWVRSRLRATPTAALLTAALVLVAVFLAAALPRALDRSADGALRAHLRAGGRDGAVVTATSRQPRPDSASSPPEALLDELAQQLLRTVHAPLRVAAGGPVYGSATADGRSLSGPGLPRPSGKDPVLGLAYLHGLDGHARLTAGRWPAGGAAGGDFEVALSERVAAQLGVTAGAVLDAGSDPFAKAPHPLRALVVGVFAPTDPEEQFWAGVDCTVTPCLAQVTTSPGERIDYWRASALVAPTATSQLFRWVAQDAQDFVRVPLDVSRVRADQLPQLRAALGSLAGGPAVSAVAAGTGRKDLQVHSALPSLLESAQRRQAAVAPLTVLGPAGAAGVALTVLLMGAALAGERRAGELRLLRARGASRTGVLRRLLGEGAVTALPAALVATVLALVLLPTPRWGGALLAAGVATLLALLVFPVRAALFPNAGTGSSARRRVVLELLALVLAAVAAVAVRERGVAPAGAGVDLLLVAAPLLLALAGAVLLARVLPALVRVAARRAAGRSGAVGFLALTRAASGGGRRPSVLPLLALLLAVTTAGFGSTVLASVDEGRLHAVRTETGGDARVTARDKLPEGFAVQAERLPGVRAGVSAWTDRLASVATADGGLLSDVTLLVVDPVQYAALERRNGQRAIDPSLLAGGTSEWVPALVTPGLAERLDDSSQSVHTGPWGVTFRRAGTIASGPALGTGEAVVVPARQAVAQVPRLGGANLWLGSGQVEAQPLLDLLRRLDPDGASAPGGYGVRTGAEQARLLAADPLQHSAARVFAVSLLAAGAFAVLAVLLTLVRSGPERAALLARLRTMGLRPRQGLAVILVESLPVALGSAVAGALLAWAAVLLLGPAVDLSALVGAAVSAGVAPSARVLLVQSLALAALCTATVVAEALVSGRRQITTELRAGDER